RIPPDCPPPGGAGASVRWTGIAVALPVSATAEVARRDSTVRTGRRKGRGSIPGLAGPRPRRSALRIGRGERVDPLGSLEAVLRRHVQKVVARAATFSEAAQRLGIDLTTLWRMRKRWDLD